MTGIALVCDASVALAWLLDEPAPDWVRDLWADLRDGSVRITVPTLLWLEVGNVLSLRRDLADEQALEGLLRLEALGFTSIELDAPMRMSALRLARGHGLTTYDAAYLALAEAIDADLATLDAGLRRATTRLGRLFGEDRPPRTSGSPTTYETSRPPDQVSLAALGARLAALRAEASRPG